MKDAEIFSLIAKEKARQENDIELIASENYVSEEILMAQGSVLTNKYAEGYPHKRYYGGCEFVDEVEELAISRVCELFNANYANVQPHSGSQANQAVFYAALNPGDSILGMDISAGGHLTHGVKVNISGKYFNAIGYKLDNNEVIDYDQVEKLALEHLPKLIIAGASAYSLEIDFARFRAIADKVGALLMVDMAHYSGLIAAGVYPSPVPYADFVTSTTHKTLRGPRGGLILTKSELHAKKINSAIFPGIQGGPLMHVIAAKAIAFKEALQPQFKTYQQNVKENAKIMAEKLTSCGLRIVSGRTESHLFLVDLTKVGITGIDAENVLSRVNITLNKNSIPNDPLKPTVSSGIRIGTPAITTRGFSKEDCILLAELIHSTLINVNNDSKLAEIALKTTALCKKYPLYHN